MIIPLRTKTLLLLFFTILLLGTSLLWAESAPPGAADAHRTVTDMRGRTVDIPEDISSIIALSAGSLRLLSYFDAVEQVAAVEDSGHGREISVHDFFYLATYRIARPELQELPSIGSSENHEAIIAENPDVIFSSAVDVSRLDQLQAVLDIPVIAVDADVELNNHQRFFEQLQLLGEVLNEQQRSQELISGIEALLADFEQRRSRTAEPKRAYAGGMMFYGPADLLRTSGDYLPFDLTGTVNVMPSNPSGNLQPYMTSIEHLIKADPRYIFIDAANSHLSRSGFHANKDVYLEHVPAFQNHDVYNTLVYKYYGTNWENQLINTYYAGTVMYPEIYGDIDIARKAEEIWELFFQVPLDYPRVAELQDPGFGPADWY